MKTYFLQLCCLLAVVASCAPEHEMKLTGNVDGLKKGTLILQKIEDSTLVSVDSIQMRGDENFEFSVSVASPQVHYLYLRLKNGDLLDERIPFFAEEGEINITTTLENFGNEYEVTGSANQEKLEGYKKLMLRYANRNVDVVAHKLKALAEKDDSAYDSLQMKEESILRSKYLTSVNYALAQKDFEIAPYIVVYETEGLSNKYLDTVYKSLPQNIKNSKYGMDLELLLSKNKAEE
ncbi:DUF4369 domain-containing protein [Marinirhabdus gelatinilytica]|uniref:Uncharacterized protein DUF4369 n=1 Tax=Marinirhabdus gelatinilytica TaxID=1703343 RepID=A0A370Q949_9FLAO|nr:DUF4369 domain-containing protein [Marinirhabdus gelatinilytica]RDK84892.1 uncharacterized protein DUF4369 [Marinirhabdus gelatinilytica]